MKFGVCIEMVLTDHPFADRLAAAADLGFENVEMWFTDLSYKGSPDKLAAMARRAGVRITNTVIGAPDGSIGGGLTDPGCRARWLQRAKATLDFTARAGIPATIVCTGNAVPGMSDEDIRASVIAGLKPTLEMAEKAGILLLLEPLNMRDHPGYWLTSGDAGATICRALDSRHMKLLFDCYHMQIMGGNLVAQITRNIDVIGHFHMAGVPGRHEIFGNEIDYRFVVEQIGALGYRGVLGLEYMPVGDHVKSLRKTVEYLGPALAAHAKKRAG